jgi:hypothetical protein
MLFNYANMKVRQVESRHRGEAIASPGNVSPVALEEFGGEVGGSVGGILDFLTPGEGGGSMVDSEEERFSEVEFHQQIARAKHDEGAVKLLFPLLSD